MFTRLFGRKITALMLALGVFLGSAGASLAVPAAKNADSMPGMTMAMPGMPCAEMMDKSSPTKQMPGKGGDCAMCVACAVNIGLPQGISFVTLLDHGEIRAISRDANRSDIATPPPLPPPILNA